jgi:type IV pilus assembly protein PilA
MKKNLKKKKGFTLIELIIVVAILGILALIAIPRFGNAQKNAKIKSDISNAKIIADAVTWVIADGGTVKSGKITPVKRTMKI